MTPDEKWAEYKQITIPATRDQVLHLINMHQNQAKTTVELINLKTDRLEELIIRLQDKLDELEARVHSHNTLHGY